MILTFDDLLDAILAFSGTDATKTATTAHRRAVQTAYTLMSTRHGWSYLATLGRITTHGHYNTGTITYDATGGANERQVTLTGGTWPSWASSGFITINDVPYSIESIKSSTVLTITAATASATDITDATPYDLLQDRYDLPIDFAAGDEAIVNQIGTILQYMHPRDWSSQRRTNVGPGQPWMFTYLGSAGTLGRMAMGLWPPPDNEYAIDFLYRRNLRPLVFSGVSGGLVSSAASVTVTGAGTAFKSAMVGSIIRFGDDGQVVPTGPMGSAPAAYERTITAVANATSLTVDSALPASIDAVAYLISDPVDIDTAVMGEYLQREIEKQWRLATRSHVRYAPETQEYTLALQQAREADNRNWSRSAALKAQNRRSGFIHYPISFTG